MSSFCVPLFIAQFGERVETEIGNDSLTAIDEDILGAEILMNELLIVQISHSLGDLGS